MALSCHTMWTGSTVSTGYISVSTTRAQHHHSRCRTPPNLSEHQLSLAPERLGSCELGVVLFRASFCARSARFPSRSRAPVSHLLKAPSMFFLLTEPRAAFRLIAPIQPTQHNVSIMHHTKIPWYGGKVCMFQSMTLPFTMPTVSGQIIGFRGNHLHTRQKTVTRCNRATEQNCRQVCYFRKWGIHAVTKKSCKRLSWDGSHYQL